MKSVYLHLHHEDLFLPDVLIPVSCPNHALAIVSYARVSLLPICIGCPMLFCQIINFWIKAIQFYKHNAPVQPIRFRHAGFDISGNNANARGIAGYVHARVKIIRITTAVI